jgi:hypothetical protein
MPTSSYGVKKIGSSVIKPDQAIIYTGQLNTIDYTKVPDGSLWINTDNGELYGKLKNSSAWSKLPANGGLTAAQVTAAIQSNLTSIGNKIETNRINLNNLTNTVNTHATQISNILSSIGSETTSGSVKARIAALETQCRELRVLYDNLYAVLIKEGIITAVVTFSLEANATYTYTPPDTGINPLRHHVELLVKDTVSGSRSYNKYINAEGIATIARDSQKCYIHNDADSTLNFMLMLL